MGQQLLTHLIESLVDHELSKAPDLPYSYIVRDFSDKVKSELLTLVDQVTPHTPWEKLRDLFSDPFIKIPKLTFDSDDAQRRDYYEKTIDKGDISRQQIEAIFAQVFSLDNQYAAKIRGIAAEAEQARLSLAALQEILGS